MSFHLPHLFQKHATASSSASRPGIFDQVIDITDSVWNTYEYEHFHYFHRQAYARTRPKKLSRRFPLVGAHHLRGSVIFKWINDLAIYWAELPLSAADLTRVMRILNANHSNNFYELTAHEPLYHDLVAFLIRCHSSLFKYPGCYHDAQRGLIIIPGDEQHFLVPEDDIFDSVKIDQEKEWQTFVHFVKVRHQKGDF